MRVAYYRLRQDRQPPFGGNHDEFAESATDHCGGERGDEIKPA